MKPLYTYSRNESGTWFRRDLNSEFQAPEFCGGYLDESPRHDHRTGLGLGKGFDENCVKCCLNFPHSEESHRMTLQANGPQAPLYTEVTPC